MLTELSTKNFLKLRNRLIDHSGRYNLPLEDIEEIVNDSIHKAMKYFDKDRGSFEGLCLVILKNKIINFKRDNPYLYLLILIDENENSFPVCDLSVDEIEESEKKEIVLKFLTALKDRLTDAEKNFFEEIFNICSTSQKSLISKAAVNLGIEPQQGWNIFRRIQRKAEDIFSEKGLEMDDLVSDEKFSYLSKSIELPDETHFADISPVFSKRMASINVEKYLKKEYDLNKFLSSLSEEEISKLNSIYDFL